MRNKSGELEALRKVTPSEARAVRICVDLVSDGPELLKGLAAALEHLTNNGQKPLLDVTQLHQSSLLRDQPGGPLDPVVRILTEEPDGQLRLDAELPFTPVVPLGTDDRELRGYALLRESFDCAFGIRVRASCPAELAVDRIERCLTGLKTAPEAVELLVDAGFLRRTIPSSECGRLIAGLAARYSFQSITVLGGSIPAKRHQLDGGVRPRHEFTLWQQLKAGSLDVRYGDYGIVHPSAAAPAKSGEGRVQPNPYLFYTGGRRSRYAFRAMARDDKRKPLPGEDPGEHFREVAQEMVGSVEYEQSATGSWGDRRLEECSRGDVVAKRSQDWIAIGTSHHIAHLAARGDRAA
ncbi:hypothetical protein AB0I53_42160 [Saccharopolyspora sp. NPDC050389]|uniref:beta family protein n=1 Tax=Saccharopolyspora sp. NPDC050389 TaxID=3155516 RepID=UPI0033DBE78A